MAAVLIFSLLATFFISKDLHKIQNKARSVLPDRLISGALAVYAELKRALAGFVKAQLTLVAMTMVLVLIGLSVLKVNHAVAIAFLIGLVDLFAVFGNRVCICAVDCLFSGGQTGAAGDRPWNSVHRRTCLQAACRTEDFKPVNRTSPFGNINRAVCRFQIVWLSRIDHGPRPSRSYSGSLYNRYF